ncbi:hypothetical protein [Hyalangium versicolor]|uniref:hypothetical protein n=1 Tax=Hyalangium versicolor TaxID=2861190 RepID=UPI001CCA8DD6|nr:hypothetical protein [Hyalangium versicolor]
MTGDPAARVPSDRWFLAALSAAILLVQLVTEAPGLGGHHLGMPMVNSGDEPHYLVVLNSLLLDGDLDLKNNYLSVHLGSLQAGAKFAGSSIDHHSSWYVDGERRVWVELFQPYVFGWPRDERGNLIPQLRPGVDPRIAQGPEYSAHPVGIGFILAPLLFPFRGTRLLEPMAVFMAGVATVLALLLFHRLLRAFSTDTRAIRFTLVAVFLGSPIWYYSRSFFNEPFLVLSVVGAFTMGLEPRRAPWAGCFVAAGMLMKPQLVLLCLPLGLPLLLRKDVRNVLLLGVAPVLAGLLLMYLNAKMYGTWSRGPYPFYRGEFWTGARGLLFHPTRGLLGFFSVAVLAVVGWPGLLRRFPLRAGMPLLGFGMVFVLTAVWKYWDGGWCYGPRLLVPVLPLLGLGMVRVLEWPFFQSFAPRWVAYNLLVFSCLVNGGAVLRYWATVDVPPGPLVASTVQWLWP